MPTQNVPDRLVGDRVTEALFQPLSASEVVAIHVPATLRYHRSPFPISG